MRRTLALSACLAMGMALATPAVAQDPDDTAPDSVAAAADDGEFQKRTLNDSPGEPMDLAVLPDGSVLHTTRAGQVWHHDARTGVNSLAAELDVYQHDEEGLQSIALDPNFRRNGWVYLYYSPPLDTPVDDPSTPVENEGDAPFSGEPEDFAPFEGHIQLSRFQFAHGELDLDSEQEIMQVPVDRGICCHVGGDIVFDSEGNLILSTGDDTNPFQSSGYAPVDDRDGRNPAFDARRTSGNTNDLRGKLLRITVGRDGGYTIPDGNLFAPDTPNTRPEIYAMGFRNPFRIEVDPDTDAIYVGDYSPDARSADPERGPAGQGRWMVVDEPANYGWPFCVTPEIAYHEWDFAAEESLGAFDCSGPTNDSPHNTGLEQLPPVVDSEIVYSYGLSDEFPELGTGGIGPMGGPAYDPDAVSPRFNRRPVAWPDSFAGKPLFYEWTRDWIKGLTLNEDQDEVTTIEPVLDEFATDNPMDLEFGPNGALYMLEYGDGFFSENPEAQLSRIDWVAAGDNHAPEVSIEADPTSASTPPLEVSFTSEATDADGDALSYKWDFDGDGTTDSREENPTHTYTEEGTYRAHLTVTDRGGRHRGKIASDYVVIQLGNQAPQVEFVSPDEDDPFTFGDTIDYEVTVTDDQEVDCADVQVHYVLGHAQHGHPQTTASGCTGSIVTTVPSGHDPEVDDLFAVFVAEYTDEGGLTGSTQVVLEPGQ